MTQKYKKPVGTMIPLTKAKRAILTVLSDGARHGYGIMKISQEQLQVRLPTGTLYRTIADLLDAKLIAECEQPPTVDVNERVGKMPRQYYQITGTGQRVLREDWESRASLNAAQQRALGLLTISFGTGWT